VRLSGRGYTVVEILMVVALSAVVLIAGLTLFTNHLGNAGRENRNVNFLLKIGSFFSVIRHDLNSAVSVEGTSENFKVIFISYNRGDKQEERVEAEYLFDKPGKSFSRKASGKTSVYDFSKDVDKSEILDFSLSTGSLVKMNLKFTDRNGKATDYAFSMFLKNSGQPPASSNSL
jgi:hypothetical protein